MSKLTVMLAFILCLEAPAPAKGAMYVIENPAGKISNPAGQMYNPATQTNNPASNIYNPGTRMDSRNPISAPNPAPPEPAAKVTAPAATPAKPAQQQKQYKQEIVPQKYHYKTAGAYLAAAKKAFVKDDYPEFLAITEDALRRIAAGTLKASAATRHTLQNYRAFGYGLLK